MADKPIPMEMAVEQSMSQAQKAMDSYFDMAQKAFSMNPWSSTEFGDKAQRFYEQNIQTTLEHVQKLSQAKDLQEAIKIQTEYLQKQMQSFVEQSKTLSEAFIKSAETMLKSGNGRSS